jgi:hypothetical protein
MYIYAQVIKVKLNISALAANNARLNLQPRLKALRKFNLYCIMVKTQNTLESNKKQTRKTNTFRSRQPYLCLYAGFRTADQSNYQTQTIMFPKFPVKSLPLITQLRKKYK